MFDFDFASLNPQSLVLQTMCSRAQQHEAGVSRARYAEDSFGWSRVRLLETRAEVLKKAGAEVVYCFGDQTFDAVTSEAPDLLVMCHTIAQKEAAAIADMVHDNLPEDKNPPGALTARRPAIHGWKIRCDDQVRPGAIGRTNRPVVELDDSATCERDHTGRAGASGALDP